MGSPAARAAPVTLSRNRGGVSAAAASAKPGTGRGGPGGSAAVAACSSRAARTSCARARASLQDHRDDCAAAPHSHLPSDRRSTCRTTAHSRDITAQALATGEPTLKQQRWRRACSSHAPRTASSSAPHM